MYYVHMHLYHMVLRLLTAFCYCSRFVLPFVVSMHSYCSYDFMTLFRPANIASPPSVTMGNQTSTDVLDMPVDPNEPTYCLCHQVSFGEMIGCDNIDVSVV